MAQMSRGLNHPVRQGQTFTIIAKTEPIPRKSTKSTSGINQMKWRIIAYIRSVELMLRLRILSPASSSPAARPHQAESVITSSGPSQLAAPRGCTAFLGIEIMEIAVEDLSAFDYWCAYDDHLWAFAYTRALLAQAAFRSHAKASVCHCAAPIV
jgi:hypothetical protein